MTEAAALLGQRWHCTFCNRTHHVPTRWVQIGKGSLNQLCQHGKDFSPEGRCLLAADEITWEVAGKSIAQRLREDRLLVKEVIIPVALHATDTAAQFLLQHWAPESAVAIAVGSGSLNDVVKWVAAQQAIPYIAVPTAASMNGYTSPIAALLVQGFKRTLPCCPPVGVLTEPEVVASAPQAMTAAGYADLMSKWVADIDWQLSHFLWGEPYCPLPRQLLEPLDPWLQARLELLARNEPETVAGLLQALIISGMGMTIAGSSTPSSGGEHLISHWLEMKAYREGREPALHGLQVGIGTLVALALYEMLLETDPSDWHLPEEMLPPAERVAEFEQRYGPMAHQVLTEFSAKWLTKEQANEKLRLLASCWEEWRERLERLRMPLPRYRDQLAKIGAATHPRDIGVSLEEIKEAILKAREIRRRWTILDTAFLIGLLPDRLDEVLLRCGWKE